MLRLLTSFPFFVLLMGIGSVAMLVPAGKRHLPGAAVGFRNRVDLR